VAYSLDVRQPWSAQRWKVKIRDKERLEPPHVSILRGTNTWRLCLRTGEFLDDSPDPDDVPDGLLEVVRANWKHLQQQWDAMYPENPVISREPDDE